MKSFNVNYRMAKILNDGLSYGSLMFWMPEEPTSANYAGTIDNDAWEMLYADSLGFNAMVSQITLDSKVRVDYSLAARTSVVKGYLDTDDYVTIIPDTLKMMPVEGRKFPYYREFETFPSLVVAMIGGAQVLVPLGYDSDVRITIPEGVHIKGLDFVTTIRGFKKLEYLHGDDWLLATDLETGTINEFEPIQATHWRIRLEGSTSSGYLGLGKFLLVVDTELSVESFPEVDLKGTITVMNREGTSHIGINNISRTTKDLPAIATNAGAYDSDKDVLFKSNKFTPGERPLLVKYEIEFGGLGDDTI